MKLMTKEIEKRLQKYPLKSQDEKKENALCVAKFFLCQGAWTWYVLEGNKLANDDWELFGVTINGEGEGEYGYFLLSQLQRLRTRMGLGVEREKYFTPTELKNINDDYLNKKLHAMGYD